jgi:TonB-dependent receptor
MSNRSAFSRKLLLASTSALSFLSLAPAMAQQAAPANNKDTQEIVVTGYRASLESALDAKRNSDLPIESIAPEDIGKMPDQNVAESLQRLPGVQIDRAQGQGTAVLIDGLRQNLTTLNGDVFLTGKEFYVSGEGSGGGAGGNAQYSSLEGIPSEEIGGIDVYKNPKASLTEGGLGGTIDLKTRDPLAQPQGLTLGGNFRMTSSQNQGDWTPVGTVVGSYNFNNRVAVTASFSYDDEKTQTNEFQDQNRNQWLITNSATGPYTGALTAAGLSTLPNNQYYIDPQLGYFSQIQDERKTIGASLGVAVQVTDSIRTRINWFYSREDDVSDTFSDKVWFNGQGTSSGVLLPGIDPTQPYSIDKNGVVQNAVFSANGAETATLYQHDISNANNLQWLTSYNPGGNFRATLDASYAYATNNLQAAQADVEHGLYDTSSGVATSPAAPGCNNGASTCTNATGSHGYQFGWTNGGTSGLPTVNYLAPFANILSNPAYTTFKSNWAWANLDSQQQYAIKIDGEYDPTFIKNVDSVITTGFRYGSRGVDQTFGRYLINGTEANGQVAGNVGSGAGSGPWLYYQDPGYGTPNIPYSTATTNPGLVKNVTLAGIGNVIVKNPGTLSNPSTYLNAVWAGAGVPNNTEAFFVDGLSSFNVSEKTYAGYLMGDLGSASNRFHLNFGVRFVETNLTINNGQSAAVPTYYGTASWNGVDNNVVPVTTNRSYQDVLPSMNFVLDASDDEKIRFGAARVTAPQDLYSLGLGNSYNFTRQTNARVNIHTGVADGFAFAGGSSGNAQLDPYRATQTQLSYENYFAKGGLVSVGGFYKQVDNFVETQNIATTVMDDFGGTTADVTEPVNAGKGKIYGLEIGGQYAFDGRIIPWLDGFGIAANYTRSQSDSQQVTSFSTSAPIPGVSKDSVTATLYYEKNGFSARGSYSWRDRAVNDSLVGSTFAFNDQNGVSKIYQVFAAPYGQLDGQIGYDFNDHYGVVFSVQNLTDSVQHTYLQWTNLPFTYDDWGRRFFLGAKFKL